MGRFRDSSDELDLAIIARRQRLLVKANPFIGATMLIVFSSVELDLRQATPAPTGIEIHAIVIGSRLTIRGQPGWRLDGEDESDAPLLRVAAVSRLSRVRVER